MPHTIHYNIKGLPLRPVQEVRNTSVSKFASQLSNVKKVWTWKVTWKNTSLLKWIMK